MEHYSEMLMDEQPNDRRQTVIESQAQEIVALKLEVQGLKGNYSFVWKWVERLIWDKSLKESAVSCLKHAPHAPWNDDKVNWDTSHKEYDCEIQALGDKNDQR